MCCGIHIGRVCRASIIGLLGVVGGLCVTHLTFTRTTKISLNIIMYLIITRRKEGNIHIKHIIIPLLGTGGVHFGSQDYYCHLWKYQIHDIQHTHNAQYFYDTCPANSV